MNIYSFSGGKDSTAMMLRELEKGSRIDEVIFIDTGAEFRPMYEHIEKFKKYTGLQVTKLEFDEPFLELMLLHEKVKGKNQGQLGYGWCGRMARWGTTFKQQIFKNYIKEKYNYNITDHQGIAFDEPKRINKNSATPYQIKYPLFEDKIVESEALKICKSAGFDWGGLYDNLDRVSCWCCRNKNLKELKNIFKFMPSEWKKLKKLENLIGATFRDDCTLEQLEKRFILEENQLTIGDFINRGENNE